MDPLSLGRSCYKKRDYEGALAAFTEGVKISTGHILLTALDHRAATFEKLNRLQPALNDAKEMIQQKPELAKGYLRCAKILQLKGEENLALKIYERGLRKVKVGIDADRPLLQEMFQKLQRKQIPAKTFDPMVMLPPELAQIVCEHLAMRDRVICLAVSKPWKRFLESLHELWTVLDVRFTKRFVRLDSLRAHLRRSNYGLSKAILCLNPKIFTSKNLEILAQLSKKLSYLEITSTGTLGDSLLTTLPKFQDLRVLIVRHADIPLPIIVKALSYCPQLQTAEFNVMKSITITQANWTHLDSLKSLRLIVGNYITPNPLNLNHLILCTPNLQSAALIHAPLPGSYNRPDYGSVDFSPWSNLEHLEFTHTNLLSCPGFPPTLRHLDLSYTYISASSPPSHESVNAINLPLLETFSTPDVFLDHNLIFKIIECSVTKGRLKCLNFISDKQKISSLPETYSFLPDVFSVPSLKTLFLEDYQDREDSLLKFLRFCPCIENLNVSNTKITGITIKELMTREIPPKWIVANGCGSLSPDAVDWARSQGARVQYSTERLSVQTRKTWQEWRKISEATS